MNPFFLYMQTILKTLFRYATDNTGERPNHSIQVISTYAIDEIIDRCGCVTKVLGGPAFWISQAVKKLPFRLTLVTPPEVAKVRVRVTRNGEVGTITKLRPFTNIAKIHKPVLVSTIGRELSPRQMQMLTGPIALDVQGYIRVLKKSVRFSLPMPLAQNIIIMKATLAETRKIDPALLADQKRYRLLLITRGAKGFILYDHGRSREYTGKPIKPKNTIGAGDTVFAVFSSIYFSGRTSHYAAQEALRDVREFLQKRV